MRPVITWRSPHLRASRKRAKDDIERQQWARRERSERALQFKVETVMVNGEKWYRAVGYGSGLTNNETVVECSA